MFWDGTRWIEDGAVARPSLARRRQGPRARLALGIVTMVLLAMPLQVVAANRTGATLTVDFGTSLHDASGDATAAYTVSGCGYRVGTGVTVVVRSPYATAFAGQMPNANGCISLDNFSTQGSGTYELTSYQTLRTKSQAMARTSFVVR
jgi:bifunctional ADP-heptose synthase (sugar kinase/adenylyltransferase)